ncbi:TIGR03503 family protein [Rheinheimera sp.]|uniref:TIGR03503 family protein n=1 Tax=Rheinheimera sp. TaxID=1869214 RepID=UPI00307FA110
MAKLILLMLLIFFPALAQQTEQQPDPTGLSLLPPLNDKNQIPLLDNRFRIDYEVAEITLVFFRKRGSASVILVKPDGSKINVINASRQGVDWYDDQSYDLIKIKNPTPGPWQALGQILPESRIMVLTDIELQVDPLPAHLMVGETIKVTARLTNGGEPIAAKDFRDLLRLDVLFISSNNADFENFGAGVVEVTSFADDGRNFDERPRDGIFTGEFRLQMVPGQWQPKYIVKTPLYTRELVQEPVILHKSPIEFIATPATAEGEMHLLTFKLADPEINPKSLALQGKIRFPNNEIQSFTLGEAAGDERVLKIVNFAPGYYKVESTLFAQTNAGRDLVINLPEATFFAEAMAKEPEPASAEASDQQATQTAAAEKTPEVSQGEPEPNEGSGPPWTLIIVLNLLLLGGGGLAVWMVMTDRTFKDLWPGKRDQIDLSALQQTEMPAAKTSKPAQKNSKSDDILELSLPDD